MRVVIIGFGLIGKKRINTLKKKEIHGIYDINIKGSEIYKKKYNCKIYQNPKEIFNDKNFDTIFISTFHNNLYSFTSLALKYNKNVLVEKPAGISSKELSKIIKLHKLRKKIILHVGYNHRFHNSVILAQKLIRENKIGKIMYVRARYGHGARLNYNKEWRMNKKISGGGELIDQGSHLIDLSRLFLKNLKLLNSNLRSFFWKSNVDDNAFLTLGNKAGKISFLHCSCTEWKNKFSFEIFGKYGKIDIASIGGSYGPEKLIYYKMKKKMGPPNMKIYNFKNKDMSWKKEVEYFRSIVNSERKKNKFKSNIFDAYENMKIIENAYKKKII